MRISHESLLDKNEQDNNAFTFPISAPKEYSRGNREKSKTPLGLPRRKWTMSKVNLFYMAHIVIGALSLIIGGAFGTLSAFIMFIPYMLAVEMAFRLGGLRRERTINLIVWNLSVLISSYTNQKWRAIRERASILYRVGLILGAIGAVISNYFLIIGTTLVLLNLIFRFADQDSEAMSKDSKHYAIVLMISGILTLFTSPLNAHGVLLLSLMLYALHESWSNYTFSVEE